MWSVKIFFYLVQFFNSVRHQIPDIHLPETLGALRTPIRTQPQKHVPKKPLFVNTTIGDGGSCADMLNRMATDSSGSYTCGQRINYLEDYEHMSEAEAYAQIAEEFPTICVCDDPPSLDCDAMLNRKAKDSSGTYTCGQRIDYLKEYESMTSAEAYHEIATEFPNTCTCDDPPMPHPIPGSRVCVFDIDGTTLNGADENLSRTAIQSCKDAGYQLAVNTAETTHQCRPYNREKLWDYGLQCDDDVYRCLVPNYSFEKSKIQNMDTISRFYGSTKACTLLFDDTQSNIDAVSGAGYASQKVHQTMNGISPSELSEALGKLASCE